MASRVDLNCDMGESFGAYTLGSDELIMSVVTSVNIACGFHAGDPLVMRRTVRMAREKRVAVGAHPGFRDLAGFGRRPMQCSTDEIYGDVLYQIGALAAICRAEQVELRHVKLHGALYNMANADPGLARAVVRAVADFDRRLLLFTLPGSVLYQMAEDGGLQPVCEGFADRTYNADGSLVNRSRPGAVIADEVAASTQARKMVLAGKVTALTGEEIPVRADTICIHGDNPYAVAFARRIRDDLQAAGVTLAPPERLG